MNDTETIGDLQWSACATALGREPATLIELCAWLDSQRAEYRALFARGAVRESFAGWLAYRMLDSQKRIAIWREKQPLTVPAQAGTVAKSTRPLAHQQIRRSVMIEKLISSLDRSQLLSLLADESVPIENLRGACCILLGGDPSKLDASAAPAPAKPGKPAAPAKPGAAAGGTATAADSAVAACLASGAGFAIADVVAASAGAATKAQVSGAIKRAVAAGKAFAFGEKRFARYGKTEAAARKRSLADRGTA